MLSCTGNASGSLRSARRRLLGAGAGLMLAVSLAACGQPATTALRCDGVAPSGPSQRVLVSFRDPTVANAPAVIDKLQSLAGACVRPVSSVSPTLHVYVVSTAVDISVLRTRWQQWPAVRAVEADVLVKRH